VATHAIAKGDPVHRYNQVIGFATQPIAPGFHVHVHNLEVRDFARDYAFGEAYKPTEFAREPATFQGIVRPDGRVATRNYIGILSTVNCSATVAKHVAEAFKGDALKDFPNVDGVVPLVHTTGCGMGTTGEGMDVLRRTLAGYARHANFAGVLIIGLGCESNQMDALAFTQGLREGPTLSMMTIQESGGTVKAVAEGVRRIKEMLSHANQVKRETVPASHIVVGLQCGGSDGYSGITANPALGAAVDLLVKNGGTAILSETPEIYGAEHLLTRRAVSREVGQKIVDRIHWWEEYTAREKGEMNNNPSPGNKAGGLTTILEKSLGAVAKGGTTGLMDVYEYAKPVTAKGFVVHGHPGLRPGLGHRPGRGRGEPDLLHHRPRARSTGASRRPSLKLATNTAMYERMEDDMDINCGQILDGSLTVQEAGEKIFALILATALRRAQQERATWVRGRRIRSVVSRCGDVNTTRRGYEGHQDRNWSSGAGAVDRRRGADEVEVGPRVRDERAVPHRRGMGGGEIKKRTNGKYDIEVFPASSLGKETDINQGLTLGTARHHLYRPALRRPHLRADLDRRRALHVPRLRPLEEILHEPALRRAGRGLQGEERRQQGGRDHLLRRAPRHVEQGDQQARGHEGAQDPRARRAALYDVPARGRRQPHADRLRRGLPRAAERHRRRAGESRCRRSTRRSSTRCRSTSCSPATSPTRCSRSWAGPRGRSSARRPGDFEAVLKEAAAKATAEIIEIEKKMAGELEKRGKTVVRVDRKPFRDSGREAAQRPGCHLVERRLRQAAEALGHVVPRESRRNCTVPAVFLCRNRIKTTSHRLDPTGESFDA
jgi:altronate hydrolase